MAVDDDDGLWGALGATVSRPFIIWSMQRTGSTSLAHLLMALSEHQAAQHEPFNSGRQFGEITDRWRADGDRARLRRDIAAALETRPVIKHCYEIVPTLLNEFLLLESKARGYAHIVLDRHDEVLRSISRELAVKTSVWLKEKLQERPDLLEEDGEALSPIHLDDTLGWANHCHKRKMWLAGRLRRARLSYYRVIYETLYSEETDQKAELLKILRFLNIQDFTAEAFDDLVEEHVTSPAQASKRYMNRIPNLDDAISTMTDFVAAHPSPFDEQGLRRSGAGDLVWLVKRRLQGMQRGR
ncbi:MAG: hypothetical protein AAFQ88_02775 [Pseudomonadota bacterium]